MEPPVVSLSGVEGASASGKPTATHELRQRLPLLATGSFRKAVIGDNDYSKFSLSPMTATHLMRSGLSAAFTPVTAVPVKSPVISTPGTPLRTTLLERYLAEHRPLDTVSETSPRPSPLTLSKAGISDSFRAYVAASPPETNSDCFSPVLGTGPAEQFQGLSPLSFDPPNSTFDEGDDGDEVVLIALPWETEGSVVPRRNSFPSYGEEVKKSGNFFKALPEPRSPNGPKSPISERGFNGRAQSPSPAFFKNVQAKPMTPPPAPTLGGFQDDVLNAPKRVGPSPFSPPPAPTAGAFPELPNPAPSGERSVFDPPPAPTLSQFPVDLPASPKISYPAPINTSFSREWRGVPSPHSSLYSPVPPEPFLDAVLRSPPPAPAPTKLQFSEQLPTSPLRSKPAPIDTSPRLDQSWNDDVLTTARTPRCPPPAPDASKLQFSEQFPASPARSKPAPIDTSPRLGSGDDYDNDPATAISTEHPPPAPNASQLQFSEQFPASPARSKPAPIDTSPRLDSSEDRDPETAISTEFPPPAPNALKLQFSEQFPASPARSKPAPIDTSPRLDSFEDPGPETAISTEFPPPAPNALKLQFSEQFPASPNRSKPAPIDTSPRLDSSEDRDPETVISTEFPPPAPNAMKLQFSEQFPASPARSKPAPIDTSPRLDSPEDPGPETAISTEFPPPAPNAMKLEFSEQFPASPARSKPAPIDTSPRLDSSEDRDPETAISISNPPPAPLPSKLQFSPQFPASPARSKPAPIDTSAASTDLSNSYAELIHSARALRSPPPAPMSSRFGPRVVRTVRFAAEVQSPAERSAVPKTPHPWLTQSPRALGGTVEVAIMTPRTAELIPKSAVERRGDPWATTLPPIEVITEAPRGRPGRRLQSAGRFTRSVSPVSPAAANSDGVLAVKILPNTVFDPSTGALVRTVEKVASAHYMLIPAVYQQEK